VVLFGIGGNASGALMAVSRWTGQHLWKITTSGSVHTPAVADGVVYFGTSEDQAGSFYAVDIATRKVLWEHHGQAWIDSPPTVAGNTVYVADNHGVLRAFDARTGRERWRFTAERRQLYASTLPVGRTVYFASGGTLYALGQDEGRR
jgi:glucose dehydrogenase